MRILFLLFAITLSACSLAPKYQRPEMSIPIAYKESGKWAAAKSVKIDNQYDTWWKMYDDPVLNKLEEKVDLTNQTVQSAYARYKQARAIAAVARSYYYPTINAVAAANRQQLSGTIANKRTHPIYNDMLLGPELAYEIDVWGKVRNNVAANEYLARASGDDWAAISLSMHAELANDYFSLRGAENLQRVLDNTVVAYQATLDLTSHRHRGGITPVVDVYQAKTQLENAKTLAADIRLQRAQYEHAIAVLIGEVPSDFSVKPQRTTFKLVTVAPDLPSTLLIRRPDIAAAEKRVQSANAQIGVARAAFFPDFNLVATLGAESAQINNLAKMPSLFWSIGPTATLVLFDGGRIQALLDQAKAIYLETVADYRQTVLTAYQEVEDNLVALRQLDIENQTQTSSTIAAYKAVQQEKYRYRGGVTTYLDVVVAQRTALSAELTEQEIRTRRQIASVQLIKALGGGWG